MQVHVAQHDADPTALWGSLLVWIDLAVFQDASLQPAPDVRCPLCLAVNGSEHRLHPLPEGLLCISRGLAVHPWSRALRNLTQIRPYSFSCDVMGQGSEP